MYIFVVPQRYIELKITLSITFYFLFVFFFPVLGQEEYRANINSFTTEDGLSHLDVYCFEKDSKGIIWVGTRDGLNRFDGRKFKVFTKKNGLNHKSINQIYRDGDFLWCIHYDRNANLNLLSIFHTHEERVYSLEEYFGKNLLFKQGDIETIYTVSQTLFIQTQEQKTYAYHPNTGLKKLPFIKKKEFVKAVLKNGDFWVLDFDKTYLYFRKLDKNGTELTHISDKNLEPYQKLTFIRETEEGELYFGYSPIDKQRLWLIIDKQDKLKAKQAFIYWNEGIKTPLISQYCRYSPQKNAYWYAVADTLALLKPNGKVLYKKKLPVKNANNSFFNSNTTFLASKTNGFIELEIQEKQFTNFFVGQGSGGFRGISKVKDRIYVNSHSQSFMFDTKTQKKEQQPFIALTTLQDKKGYLWGHKEKYLIKYDTNLKKIDSYNVNYDFSIPVWAMYEDKNGLIWYSDMGLTSFNPKTEELKKVSFNEFSDIEKGIVYHFYEKKDGNILLCSTTGLYEMQLGKGITARYWSGAVGKYHIPAKDFRHLYFDKSTQSYWLATNETGLIHWNPRTNISKVYTFNYKGANIIHAVYADKFGFLWLSTENGIIQFEKKTGDFKTFSTKEGTSSHEFNRISHFQDQESGKIYFGSILGLTVFDPKDFYQDFKDLNKIKIIPIEISQYKDDAEEIQNVTADFYQKKQVDFYPNDRFLNITFGLNKYSYSKDAVYYYKLANVDKNWTISKDNEITISGMPYGEQVLEVKALLNNGKYTQEHLEILINVHKPFYLRWWFFVIFFSIIFGITLFYIYYRTQKLELQKIVLEQEVQKRTLKIEKDKQIIEKQAEKLVELDKTKTRFFANVSHELRTPITLIKAPIQSVINSQVLSKNNEYLLKKAKDNTNNLLNLVNEILDLTKLDNQKLKLKEEKVLFYNFIRQLVSNFQSIAQVQGIEMTLEYLAEKELQILLDKDKFQKIFNNLLSNALKFTPPQGKIAITIDDLGREILLKVKDTGRGIPKQDIPHVFERYFQASQNDKAEGGLGIGLALSMELINLFKGKIGLESSTKKEKQGTTFLVQFPKKEVLNMLSSQDIISLESDFDKPENLQNSPQNTLTNEKATKNILIVEDNKDLREYLTFVLSNYYQVISAENGKKAIDILSKERLPNLIISDLMMPIMDGYEFLELVKNNKNWSGLPFIMLTARAERQDKLKALRVGVDDYITKPFDDEELLVRIENLLLNYEEKIAYRQVEQENTQNSPVEKTVTKLNLKDKKWLEDFENLVIKQINSSLFSIDFLAELIGVNRITLYKKVKTLTGLTPNQYIRAIRLKMARDILEKQECSTIKEVAKRVGFKKPEYFSSLFKKEYGKSPSDYLS